MKQFAKTYKWLLIITSVLSIMILLIVWFAYYYGSKHQCIPTLISADGLLSYGGALIATIASIFLGLVALYQSHVANELNKKLMQQNDDIHKQTIEKSVLPYIALKRIHYSQRAKGTAALLGSNFTGVRNQQPKDAFESEQAVIYEETDITEYFIVIDENSIEILREEPGCISKFKYTIFQYKESKLDGATVISGYNKEDTYFPVFARNIGQGCAAWLVCGVFRSGIENDDNQWKSMLINPLPVNDSIRLNIYFGKSVDRKQEYFLRFKYANIYGDEYIQEYSLTKNFLDLNSYQRKVIKNNE